MPTVYVDPEIFVEHNGIVVYHTYKNEDFLNRYRYWFTTDPGDYAGPSREFDVRTLPGWDDAHGDYAVDSDANSRRTIIAAIEAGLIEPNP